MRKFHVVCVALAVLSAAPSITRANEGDSALAACDVAQLTTIRTDFPLESQNRGEHGRVVLKVAIGKDGRAIDSQVARSSGFATLDKAAADSVARHWRFDVAHCAPAQLPTSSFVTVQFQRAARHTVSGTINTHRVTSGNNPETQSRCDTTRNNAGDEIVACLANPSVAKASPAVEKSQASAALLNADLAKAE